MDEPEPIVDGKTGYCPNAGIPQLREAVAADISASHGIEYAMENVAVQPGGKPTISKFLHAVMNRGDHVLYPNPGYPIYESQIEYLGGTAVPYGYVEVEDNFDLDFDARHIVFAWKSAHEAGYRIYEIEIDPSTGLRAKASPASRSRSASSAHASSSLRNPSWTAPSSPMPPNSAVGHAMQASGAFVDPPIIACAPSPYDLRSTIEMSGTEMLAPVTNSRPHLRSSACCSRPTARSSRLYRAGESATSPPSWWRWPARWPA